MVAAGKKAHLTRLKNQKVLGFRTNKKSRKKYPIIGRAGKKNKPQKIKLTQKSLNVAPKKWAQESQIKKGALKQYGYNPNDIAKSRRAALMKGINVEGYMKMMRRVQWLVNVAKDGSKLDRVYKQDLAFVEGMKTERTKHYREIMQRLSKKPKGRKIVATYPSKSRPGVKYYVSEGPHGGLQCTCPAWIFPDRGEPRDCWHCKDYRNKHEIAIPA